MSGRVYYRVYYNEIDPFAAQWLRNLMAGGLIPGGDVDERSIADVRASDLVGYGQCHFFAGIGGWPYALDLAGWGARPVWTGSCPCQPFSSAGRQGGGDDSRHLWPSWFRLVRECRPDCLIGEQVEGSVGFGWLDRVFADLENEGYACGATVLGAHSIGAPHIRQRLFWVADASSTRSGRDAGAVPKAQAPSDRERIEPRRVADELIPHGATGGLGDALGTRLEERAGERRDDGPQRASAERTGGDAGGLADAESAKSSQHWTEQSGTQGRFADSGGVGDATISGWREQPGRDGGARDGTAAQPRRSGDAWSAAEWLRCLDGKARRVEPSIFPLAHAGEWGAGSRVGILRGTGNAIVPALAAEFIRAFRDINGE